MPPTSPTQHLTLYYRQGNSDKVYQASIEPVGEGFVVNVAYGRRGSTFTTGSKTRTPVDAASALAVFDRLVREKMAKGYTPGQSGSRYQSSEVRGPRLLPQLLNPVDLGEIDALIASQDWGLQEKFDGRRVLIQKIGPAIIGFNRRGLPIGLPQQWVTDLTQLPVDVTLDGEAVGDRFHAFDLLELGGQDLRTKPLIERLSSLVNLIGPLRKESLQPVNTAFGSEYKRQRFAEFQASGREGVVFKRLDAHYSTGRPNTGGPALKHKFTASLSALVTRINAQRSVALQLRGEKGWQSAGNVTIPANQPVPQPGDVVEIRYLYAFPESGVLFQPVYLGLRTDITPGECGTRQLKFKASDDDDA